MQPGRLPLRRLSLRISHSHVQWSFPLSRREFHSSSQRQTSLNLQEFQLLSSDTKAGLAEDEIFEDRVREVQQWWSSPRFRGLKRPYSAEDVVSKGGALPQSYPSSLMARKLFNLLHKKAANGQPLHTCKSIMASRGDER